MALSTILTTLFVGGAYAITPVPIKTGCSTFPTYDASTGMTDLFQVTVSGCVNTTAPSNSRQACSIEGFGDSSVVRQVFDEQGGIKQGYITIVHKNDLAKIPLRCNDATPNLLEGRVETGVSDFSWQQLNITNIPYSASLMWGLPEDESISVEFYNHYNDGKKEDGIFLGANNVTQWGIKYYGPDAGSHGLPYWFFRLLGEGSEDPVTGEEVAEGEYRTFIRVDGS
ncbi:hypothetical protein MW887_000678 [Aspergillus wentii]|nr:hypothetical protein MW887_000678 [Aspergillus wentii]